MSLTNDALDAEIARIETEWDKLIIAKRADEGQRIYGETFHALLSERAIRRRASQVPVVRLRLMAGEVSRDLDRACGEALGWRVDHDEYWNWNEGPRYDPPGDAWCIRKDGRRDVPCNEALPHFTPETFEAALALEPTP